MATSTQSTAASLPHPLFGELSRHWGWLLAVGILSVILGTIGLGMTWMLTLASVVYFGVLLIVIGVAQLLQTFKSAGWKSTFLQILIGLLYLAAGIMVVSRPLLASLTLTWALGFALIVVGVMRIVVGVQHRGTSGWGGGLVGGIITLLLGLLILARWPSDALWVIGLFLAIELDRQRLHADSRRAGGSPGAPARAGIGFAFDK